MRALVWSDDALREFEGAIGYVSRDNPRAASGMADRIEAAIDLLAKMPIGRPGRVKGTYEKRVLRTPYTVVYRLSEHRITILHVIHGSRNWPGD